MDLTKAGMSALELAIRNIVAGKCVRVDLGHDTIVYKVPSNSPKKYTIRVDIKVTEEQDA